MAVLIVLFCAFAAFIGLIMEAYKKVLRKDKAAVWEIRLIAFALSLIAGGLMTLMIDAPTLAPMLVDSPWLTIPYILITYLLQLPACMKVWKPILRKWMDRRLK